MALPLKQIPGGGGGYLTVTMTQRESGLICMTEFFKDSKPLDMNFMQFCTHVYELSTRFFHQKQVYKKLHVFFIRTLGSSFSLLFLIFLYIFSLRFFLFCFLFSVSNS